MILKRVSVKNFRSIREVAVNVKSQMAIVGGNGAGKSTILRAIEKFYSQSATVELDDFFGRQVTEPIEIALTFTELNEIEHEMFSSRIDNGEMTVVRVFEAGAGRNNGRYYGMTVQHVPFQEIRNAIGANPQRAAYNSLRQGDRKYASLPAVSSAAQIGPALASWEAQNPNECQTARDDGQFFGFTNVARGALQKATSFVFIPAVRDASADALDSRGAVISRLLELVVRSAIQRRGEIQNFQARVSQEYRALTDPEKLHELSGLSSELTDTLKVFYNEAAVALRWQPTQDFEIPLPSADVLLDDDGFEGPVDRKGHGLQRAFILTLLQHLAKATSAQVEGEELSTKVLEEGGQSDGGISPPPFTLPGLILAIEEPELYQHPTKQRHFAKVLSQLSSGKLLGVARQTQVLFATHSNLFVSMDRFEEVNLARRRALIGNPYKECRLTNSTLAEVASRLEAAYGRDPGTYTADSLRSRLHIVNAEITEGLFADTVVLVEGISDQAALIAAALFEKVDLQALGIAVLQVDGKSKLDRPTAIFMAPDIPTYVVWDCDKRADGIHGVEQNRAMQTLMNVSAPDVVDAASIIADNFCCFETKLETVLKGELGDDVYYSELNILKAKYGIQKNEDAEKAPSVMRELLEGAAAKGKKSQTLSALIKRIVELRNRLPAEHIEGRAAA